MSWFFLSLVSLLGWGFADLFYKLGTDDDDKYSHLKIAVWVGIVMGACAFALLPFSETTFSIASLGANAVKYLPASLSYIISMVIGYAGLRYLEMSIISPVQNSSGALSTVCMLIYFLIAGKITDFREYFSLLDIIATVLIVAGVIALAIVERHISVQMSGINVGKGQEKQIDRKYTAGALALIFPIAYCIFDTIGTAADGVILDEETGLGLGEIDVIIIYGLTFLLVGIGNWIFLLIKTKRPYNPFAKKEIPKGIAAVCEEFGQVFYVYAMADKPMLAAPLVGSYCIVSMLLGRIFAGEKLKKTQYICVGIVVLGIVILGISEGINS